MSVMYTQNDKMKFSWRQAYEQWGTVLSRHLCVRVKLVVQDCYSSFKLTKMHKAASIALVINVNIMHNAYVII